MFSRERIDIPDRAYTVRSLHLHLIDLWLPYYECHQCNWFETCLFPIRSSVYERSKDIQCGVASKALLNFLIAWWPRFRRWPARRRQALIDAAFHFVRYILDSHLTTGTLVYNLSPDWWGIELASQLSVGSLSQRGTLEALAAAARKLPLSWVPGSSVFYVEGRSEQLFLRRMADMRFFSSDVTSIECLNGKKNATRERLPVDLLARRGQNIYLQLDADGARTAANRRLVAAIENHGGRVFVFRRDFESAFPPVILHASLRELDLKVDLEWLEERLRNKRSSIIRMVEQKTKRSVTKTKLAPLLAKDVYRNWSKLVRECPNNEIVQWLLLLKTGRLYRPRATVSDSKSDDD